MRSKLKGVEYVFILKFRDSDCWIAPWNGDPGRTLERDSARDFSTRENAQKFADKVIEENSHRKFNLIVEPK